MSTIKSTITSRCYGGCQDIMAEIIFDIKTRVVTLDVVSPIVIT